MHCRLAKKMLSRIAGALFLLAATACVGWQPLGSSRLHRARHPHVSLDEQWRPKTVDPLGNAFGMPSQKERTYTLWLDLRTAENTFAQMALVKLFYAVRKIVDEAGRALPRGSAVQGLLFDEDRFERADTIGSDGVPVYVQSADGTLQNATTRELVPLAAELRAPVARDELLKAQEALEAFASEVAEGSLTTAIALPADAMLWAEALTGLDPSELEGLEANEGA